MYNVNCNRQELIFVGKEDPCMKKMVSLLLAAILVFSLVLPVSAFGDGKTMEELIAEYYTIGAEENTFSGLYNRMCVDLDLRIFPIPIPTETAREGEYGNSGEYETVAVLKDDDESYETIGYVCTKAGIREFIVRSWRGRHRDESEIGMDVYYSLDGSYLGNIQHDYTAGTASSSHRCPYFVPGEPINKD